MNTLRIDLLLFAKMLALREKSKVGERGYIDFGSSGTGMPESSQGGRDTCRSFISCVGIFGGRIISPYKEFKPFQAGHVW